MKAIETIYQGYRFRSRLEARWACYFNAMSFKYFYEHEGFDLGDIGWYLPDFYLPHVKMWAEVKPEKFNNDELKKAEALVIFTKKPLLMLEGPPERRVYYALCFDGHCKPNGTYGVDFILSNYHEYYKKEQRFFGNCGYETEVFEDWFDDIDIGVTVARSARF